MLLSLLLISFVSIVTVRGSSCSRTGGVQSESQYKKLYNDCTDWYVDGHISSGVYLINPGGEEPFKVYILCMHYGVTEEALLY